MKYIFYTLILLTISCNSIEHESKLLLLKVDFQTNKFEEGIEIPFPDTSLNILTDFLRPHDFGNIRLFQEGSNDTIFDGTIVWEGTGKRTFPKEMLPYRKFHFRKKDTPLPPESKIKFITEKGNYHNIWSAIENLSIVHQYLKSNPNGEIFFFLYNPSVGILDRSKSDWYIILKN